MSQTVAPWVKASDGTSKYLFGFYCERCGAQLPVGTPVGLTTFVDAGRNFIARHAKCKNPAPPPPQ